jgi:NTE family protein
MSPVPIAPVHDVLGGQPEEGRGLCLSGGGYRAMVFHIGGLWRLNELGLLGTLRRVSSVSGGSITAAVLGMNWKALGVTATKPSTPTETFNQYVVNPLRQLASATIDEGAIFGGIFLPGTIADHVADKYDKLLFQGRTLQDLPSDDEGPRFVINATNVQSGVLMRFSKPYMRDFRVGQVLNPKLPLARAVGASSAFPPILSPAGIDAEKYGLQFEPTDGTEDLHFPPYTTMLVLSDGGVYDNLGLETVWKRYKTILVSDGGGHYKPEPEPNHDWARHAYRVLDLIDSQVRALRTRDLISLLQSHIRTGAYWGIRQELAKIDPASTFNAPLSRTTELAGYPTRLQKMDDEIQERLVNWGYAIACTSIRKFWPDAAQAPEELPYPQTQI